MKEEPTHDNEEGLTANPCGDAVASTPAHTAEAATCEEIERERRQRLEDVRRERKGRLEAQQQARRLELEVEEAHRRVERLELALWESQQEAWQLREELEAERGKGL